MISTIKRKRNSLHHKKVHFKRDLSVLHGNHLYPVHSARDSWNPASTSMEFSMSSSSSSPSISAPDDGTLNTERRLSSPRLSLTEQCEQFGVKLSPYHQTKRVFDCVIAVLLLIPGIPLILFLGALVKLTSKGPAIYTQVRVGKDGRVFTMYKIRTMRIDAEAKTGAVWAVKKDPRVTLLGRILRKLHLDEIPQLFNVIRGEMALVGPRPERPEFVDILDRKIDGYILRLLVVPGVTGYAQLNLPADRELNDVRRKLALDMEYIENASFWFDFRLILGTVCRLFKYAHKTPLQFLGIYQTAENSPWAERYEVPQGDEISSPSGEQRLDLIFSNPTATMEFNLRTGTSNLRTGTTPRQLEPVK